MTANIYEVSGRWLRVVSDDFFGPCVHSPNGRFTLAWDNARVETGDAGIARRGRFLLLEAGRIRVHGDMRTALTGCVSDAGTFLIGCGPKRAHRQEGTVYVISPRGKALIKHRINALLGASAISDDHCYAACQATTSDADNADRGRLHFFDLKDGCLLWKKRVETGWPTRYEFDTLGRVLLAYCGPDGRDGCCRYAFDGSRLDSEK